MTQFPPTREAALARIAAVQPAEYGRSRNSLNGAVTYVSPYLTHGFVSVPEVLEGVRSQHRLSAQDKLVFELGWREYYRHVWQHRGNGIFKSLHEGILPEEAYTHEIPLDILSGCTGVPAIDMSVQTLYNTGYLHNHARMWLASYMVHLRKVHWRAGADWLYGHLLDGDLASNHLSWQWVAGTGSHKPYLFNAENVARYAPAAWHSAGSVIDTSYEALDEIAKQTLPVASSFDASNSIKEPVLMAAPPAVLNISKPNASKVKGRDVWLVHPWSLGNLPSDLAKDTLVIGVYLSEFHRDWPWDERRWLFVQSRMNELASECWFGDALSIAAALEGAARVRGVMEAHIASLLPALGQFSPAPALFDEVERRCDSFSKWWNVVAR
jgi:deoxyribodipyrimidine photo-lyase